MMGQRQIQHDLRIPHPPGEIEAACQALFLKQRHALDAGLGKINQASAIGLSIQTKRITLSLLMQDDTHHDDQPKISTPSPTGKESREVLD